MPETYTLIRDATGEIAETIDEEEFNLWLAAPELLDALRKMFKLVPDYPPHDPSHYIVAEARKVYHKARGEA